MLLKYTVCASISLLFLRPEITAKQRSPPRIMSNNTWRKSEKKYSELKDEVASISPPCVANVLLLGPAGAGKSSTVNSMLSIDKGRKANMAYTGVDASSFTTSYKRLIMENELKKCCFWDTMGIEPAKDGGIRIDDLTRLLKGHVKNGYKFNTRSSISKDSRYFLKKPDIEDQIHCIVFVFDSTTVNDIGIEQWKEKVKAFQKGSKILDIPCIMILTKIDQLDEEVKPDVSKAFQSKKVRDVVQFASESLGIPVGNIHPVKNYENEIELDEETSKLLLLALRQIMYYALDRIGELRRKKKNGCAVS